jgi:hypothetical protein
MRNWMRTTLSILAAAVTALVLMAAPASAAGNTQIAGVGTFDGDGACTEIPSFFTMQMVGDLVGCWYTDTLEVVQSTPSGVYQERGTETFIGCLSDGTTCGTFSTTYKFTAKYAVDGAEIHGRCQHPIVSGTGNFEGITGRVDFKDDVQTGEFNYRGHIELP